MDKQNIYLFYGSDNYSAVAKVNHWRSEFEKKYGDLNSQIFEGEDLTAADFNEAVDTLPFLSDKKLIIIRDFFRHAPDEDEFEDTQSAGNQAPKKANKGEDTQKKIAEKLEEMAKDTSNYCIIVFIEHEKPDSRTSLFKKIKAMGHIIEFPEPDRTKLIQWINQEFSKKNIQIRTYEAGLLAETVGPNLWQMSQEVEKLSLHAHSENPAERTINEAAIESLVSPNLTDSIFKLTDSIAAKNHKASIKILNTLLGSGENLMQIFFMIVRHFRILIQVQACLGKKMAQPQIIQKLKLHPFVITKTAQQCRNFTVLQTAAIYRKLLQIDIDGKSGKIKISVADSNELRLALEKLIVELCIS